MKVALIAGEASGDLLAAELMSSLQAQCPTVQFIGMGGPKMQALGLDSWYDYKTLSIMGFIEVLKSLPKLLRLRKNLLTRLIAEQPDVVIGIDAPDFNLGLERKCKQAGLRTVHFVSPSIWAWREGRAKKIGQSCDLVLCLFPMEPELYARYGVNARFVGHPLADIIELQPDKNLARSQLNLNDHKTLAILPGSRQSEINRMLPTFIEATQELQKVDAHLQVLIPAANNNCHAIITEHLVKQPLKNIQIIHHQAQALMIASDAVLLTSGTATLEAMLCKRPMVVAYKNSKLTIFIIRLFNLIKIKTFSLPNILSGKTLVTELIQEDCNVKTVTQAMQDVLSDTYDVEKLQQQFLDIHLVLKKKAANQAAEAVLSLVKQTPK
ncbi:MAG TPA: lipid-A-disaccharide synthase [Arenimonas sp.]|nr:lipid-A-disaccharide synthase [Arenimonas sp.]